MGKTWEDVELPMLANISDIPVLNSLNCGKYNNNYSWN